MYVALTWVMCTFIVCCALCVALAFAHRENMYKIYTIENYLTKMAEKGIVIDEIKIKGLVD